MIRHTPKQDSYEVRATFVVAENGIAGRSVAVVGDFNGWDPTAAPMRKRGDERMATVTVHGGRRYAFRYLCDDGTWFNDESADAYEANHFGVENCILDLSGAA